MPHKAGSRIPQFKLTKDEENAIYEEVDAILEDTLRSATESRSRRPLSPTPSDSSDGYSESFSNEWQCVKKTHGLRVYKEKVRSNSRGKVNTLGSEEESDWDGPSRPYLYTDVDDHQPDLHSPAPSSDGATSSNNASSADRNDAGFIRNLKPSKTPMFVVTGTQDGTVDDFQLGSVPQDLTSWRIDHSFLRSKFHSVRTLATLQRMTEEDPFRYVGIKWIVKKRPMYMTGVASSRDHVCLHATGTTTDSDGRKVAYSLLHSLNKHPRVCALPSTTGFIRANMSFCFLAWQSDDSDAVLETHIRGFVDPGGNLAEAATTMFCVEIFEAALDIITSAVCKRVRYLARLSLSESASDIKEKSSDCCSVCERRASKSPFRKSITPCQVCGAYACSKCAVELNMAAGILTDEDAHGSSKELWSTCYGCIMRAKALDANQVGRACM